MLYSVCYVFSGRMHSHYHSSIFPAFVPSNLLSMIWESIHTRTRTHKRSITALQAKILADYTTLLRINNSNKKCYFSEENIFQNAQWPKIRSEWEMFVISMPQKRMFQNAIPACILLRWRSSMFHHKNTAGNNYATWYSVYLIKSTQNITCSINWRLYINFHFNLDTEVGQDHLEQGPIIIIIKH
jgi:hypothetical protein